MPNLSKIDEIKNKINEQKALIKNNLADNDYNYTAQSLLEAEELVNSSPEVQQARRIQGIQQDIINLKRQNIDKLNTQQNFNNLIALAQNQNYIDNSDIKDSALMKFAQGNLSNPSNSLNSIRNAEMIEDINSANNKRNILELNRLKLLNNIVNQENDTALKHKYLDLEQEELNSKNLNFNNQLNDNSKLLASAIQNQKDIATIQGISDIHNIDPFEQKNTYSRTAQFADSWDRLKRDTWDFIGNSVKGVASLSALGTDDDRAWYQKMYDYQNDPNNANFFNQWSDDLTQEIKDRNVSDYFTNGKNLDDLRKYGATGILDTLGGYWDTGTSGIASSAAEMGSYIAPSIIAKIGSKMVKGATTLDKLANNGLKEGSLTKKAVDVAENFVDTSKATTAVKNTIKEGADSSKFFGSILNSGGNFAEYMGLPGVQASRMERERIANLQGKDPNDIKSHEVGYSPSGLTTGLAYGLLNKMEIEGLARLAGTKGISALSRNKIIDNLFNNRVTNGAEKYLNNRIGKGATELAKMAGKTSLGIAGEMPQEYLQTRLEQAYTDPLGSSAKHHKEAVEAAKLAGISAGIMSGGAASISPAVKALGEVKNKAVDYFSKPNEEKETKKQREKIINNLKAHYDPKNPNKMSANDYLTTMKNHNDIFINEGNTNKNGVKYGKGFSDKYNQIIDNFNIKDNSEINKNSDNRKAYINSLNKVANDFAELSGFTSEEDKKVFLKHIVGDLKTSFTQEELAELGIQDTDYDLYTRKDLNEAIKTDKKLASEVKKDLFPNKLLSQLTNAERVKFLDEFESRLEEKTKNNTSTQEDTQEDIETDTIEQDNTQTQENETKQEHNVNKNMSGKFHKFSHTDKEVHLGAEVTDQDEIRTGEIYGKEKTNQFLNDIDISPSNSKKTISNDDANAIIDELNYMLSMNSDDLSSENRNKLENSYTSQAIKKAHLFLNNIFMELTDSTTESERNNIISEWLEHLKNTNEYSENEKAIILAFLNRLLNLGKIKKKSKLEREFLKIASILNSLFPDNNNNTNGTKQTQHRTKTTKNKTFSSQNHQSNNATDSILNKIDSYIKGISGLSIQTQILRRNKDITSSDVAIEQLSFASKLYEKIKQVIIDFGHGDINLRIARKALNRYIAQFEAFYDKLKKKRNILKQIQKDFTIINNKIQSNENLSDYLISIDGSDSIVFKINYNTGEFYPVKKTDHIFGKSTQENSKLLAKFNKEESYASYFAVHLEKDTDLNYFATQQSLSNFIASLDQELVFIEDKQEGLKAQVERLKKSALYTEIKKGTEASAYSKDFDYSQNADEFEKEAIDTYKKLVKRIEEIKRVLQRIKKAGIKSVIKNSEFDNKTVSEIQNMLIVAENQLEALRQKSLLFFNNDEIADTIIFKEKYMSLKLQELLELVDDDVKKAPTIFEKIVRGLKRLIGADKSVTVLRNAYEAQKRQINTLRRMRGLQKIDFESMEREVDESLKNIKGGVVKPTLAEQVNYIINELAIYDSLFYNTSLNSNFSLDASSLLKELNDSVVDEKTLIIKKDLLNRFFTFNIGKVKSFNIFDKNIKTAKFNDKTEEFITNIENELDRLIVEKFKGKTFNSLNNYFTDMYKLDNYGNIVGIKDVYKRAVAISLINVLTQDNVSNAVFGSAESMTKVMSKDSNNTKETISLQSTMVSKLFRNLLGLNINKDLSISDQMKAESILEKTLGEWLSELSKAKIDNSEIFNINKISSNLELKDKKLLNELKKDNKKLEKSGLFINNSAITTSPSEAFKRFKSTEKGSILKQDSELKGVLAAYMMSSTPIKLDLEKMLEYVNTIFNKEHPEIFIAHILKSTSIKTGFLNKSNLKDIEKSIRDILKNIGWTEQEINTYIDKMYNNTNAQLDDDISANPVFQGFIKPTILAEIRNLKDIAEVAFGPYMDGQEVYMTENLLSNYRRNIIGNKANQQNNKTFRSFLNGIFSPSDGGKAVEYYKINDIDSFTTWDDYYNEILLALGSKFEDIEIQKASNAELAAEFEILQNELFIARFKNDKNAIKAAEEALKEFDNKQKEIVKEKLNKGKEDVTKKVNHAQEIMKKVSNVTEFMVEVFSNDAYKDTLQKLSPRDFIRLYELLNKINSFKNKFNKNPYLKDNFISLLDTIGNTETDAQTMGPSSRGSLEGVSSFIESIAMRSYIITGMLTGNAMTEDNYNLTAEKFGEILFGKEFLESGEIGSYTAEELLQGKLISDLQDKIKDRFNLTDTLDDDNVFLSISGLLFNSMFEKVFDKAKKEGKGIDKAIKFSDLLKENQSAFRSTIKPVLYLFGYGSGAKNNTINLIESLYKKALPELIVSIQIKMANRHFTSIPKFLKDDNSGLTPTEKLFLQALQISSKEDLDTLFTMDTQGIINVENYLKKMNKIGEIFKIITHESLLNIAPGQIEFNDTLLNIAKTHMQEFHKDLIKTLKNKEKFGDKYKHLKAVWETKLNNDNLEGFDISDISIKDLEEAFDILMKENPKHIGIMLNIANSNGVDITDPKSAIFTFFTDSIIDTNQKVTDDPYRSSITLSKKYIVFKANAVLTTLGHSDDNRVVSLTQLQAIQDNMGYIINNYDAVTARWILKRYLVKTLNQKFLDIMMDKDENYAYKILESVMDLNDNELRTKAQYYIEALDIYYDNIKAYGARVGIFDDIARDGSLDAVYTPDKTESDKAKARLKANEETGKRLTGFGRDVQPIINRLIEKLKIADFYKVTDNSNTSKQNFLKQIKELLNAYVETNKLVKNDKLLKDLNPEELKGLSVEAQIIASIINTIEELEQLPNNKLDIAKIFNTLGELNVTNSELISNEYNKDDKSNIDKNKIRKNLSIQGILEKAILQEYFSEIPELPVKSNNQDMPLISDYHVLNTFANHIKSKFKSLFTAKTQRNLEYISSGITLASNFIRRLLNSDDSKVSKREIKLSIEIDDNGKNSLVLVKQGKSYTLDEAKLKDNKVFTPGSILVYSEEIKKEFPSIIHEVEALSKQNGIDIAHYVYNRNTFEKKIPKSNPSSNSVEYIFDYNSTANELFKYLSSGNLVYILKALDYIDNHLPQDADIADKILNALNKKLAQSKIEIKSKNRLNEPIFISDLDSLKSKIDELLKDTIFYNEETNNKVENLITMVETNITDTDEYYNLSDISPIEPINEEQDTDNDKSTDKIEPTNGNTHLSQNSQKRRNRRENKSADINETLAEYNDFNPNSSIDDLETIFNTLLKEENISDKQAEHLRWILRTLIGITEKSRKTLKGLNIKIIKSSGEETLGQFTSGSSNSIVIVLGDKPSSVGLTGVEAYVHELLHAIIEYARESNDPEIKAEVNALMAEVNKIANKFLSSVATFEAKLELANELGIIGDSNVEKVEILQESYLDYIKDNPSEMITIGLANKVIFDRLSKIDLNKDNTGKNFLERVINILSKLLKTLLGQEINVDNMDATASEALYKLTQRIAENNNVLMNKYKDTQKKSVITKTLDALDSVANATVKKWVDNRKIHIKSSDSIPTNILAIAKLIPFSIKDPIIAKMLKDALKNKFNIAPDSFIFTTLSTIQSLDIGKKLANTFMAKSNSLDKHRLLRFASIQKELKDAFNRELSDDEATELGNFIIKTDLQSAFENINEVYNLMKNKNRKEINKSLETLINKYKTELSKLDKMDNRIYKYYITEMDKLAKYMATNQAQSFMLMNANNIANMLTEKQAIRYQLDMNMVSKAIPLIDKIVTLQTLTMIDDKTIDTFKTLMESESKGVEFAFNHHKMQKRDFNHDFVGKNGVSNEVKGYYTSGNNSSVELLIGLKSEENIMATNGYKIVEVFDDAILDGHNPLVLYATDFSTQAAFNRAGFRTTGKSARGLTLSSIVDFYGQQNMKTTNEKKALQYRLMNLLEKSNNKTVTKFIPIFDNNGNMTDVRLLIDNKMKEDLKLSTPNIFEALPTMFSRYWDEKESEEHNNEYMRELQTYYNNNKNEYDFVYIGPDGIQARNSHLLKDSSIKDLQEIWDLLPYKTKQFIQTNLNMDKGIYIRADLIPTIAGTRDFRFTETGVFNRVINSNTTYGKIISYCAKKAEYSLLKFAKKNRERIVIKTPQVLLSNWASNINVLMSYRISPLKIAKKVSEGIAAIQDYNDLQFKLVHLKDKFNLEKDNNKKEYINNQIEKLEERIKQSSIYEFDKRGLISDLTDDMPNLNTKELDYIDRQLTAMADRMGIPMPVRELFDQIMINEGTPIHKAMSTMTKYSDLLARYVLNDHLQSEGKMSSEEIFDLLDRAFINYSVADHKLLKYFNDIGFMRFTKFWIRAQQYLASDMLGSKLATWLTTNLAYNMLGIPMASPLDAALWKKFGTGISYTFRMPGYEILHDYSNDLIHIDNFVNLIPGVNFKI